MMNYRKVYLFTLSFLLLIVISCKHKQFKVPISEIDLKINIHRFENDLFTIQPDSIPFALPELQDKYGNFLTVFGYVTNIGNPSDETYSYFLQSFVSNKTNADVYQIIKKDFADMTDIEIKLNSGFQHYKYYFPKKHIPEIYTFISGFNNSIVIDTNILAIGLDRYLGPKCKYYKELGIPQYLTIKMVKEKIPTDCMYAWGRTEFNLKDSKNAKISDNVLNNIIYEGKLKYFIKAMMPEEPEELIMGFTSEQLAWCEENESEMWTYLIENKLLYSTDYLKIRKLTGDAPFTTFFPKGSPGQAAIWLGYRIVSKYMENTPQESLPELMKNTDYQNILHLSKYNPN